MSEHTPKKRFFRIPENFSEATDAEIDAFAQSIMDALFADIEDGPIDAVNLP